VNSEGGRAIPQAGNAMLAIKAPSDGGRYRGGTLIQCGPALTYKLRAISKFIPGTMFQGVQQIQ